MNECTGCGRNFGGIVAFDMHRVGSHPQKGPADWLDRIRAGLVDPLEDWQPTPHFGRRCLEDDELRAKGLVEKGGTWGRVVDIERQERLRAGREAV